MARTWTPDLPKFEIIIETESDFPVQDATTITLNTWNYNIRDTIVTNKQFIIPIWAVIEIIGWDPFISGIVYTWTLWAFKGTDFLWFTHDHVFISTPLWSVYDINNASPVGSQIFMEDTAFVDCNSIWIIKNIAQFSGYFNAYTDIWQWFNLDGVRLTNLSQCQFNTWKDQVSSVMFTFDWTIDAIALHNIEYIPNTNENVFDFKTTATIWWSTITANIFNKTWWGWLFAAWSDDETTPELKFSANSNIPESIVFGNMTLPSIETVAITTIWVPVIVNDTSTWWTNIWTELWNTSRFTFISSLGRYTYTGLEDVNVWVSVSCTIEKSWGWADIISTIIAKNWVAIPESKSVTQSGTPTTVESIANVSLVTWDFIELMVQNDSTIVDIDVDISNFIIKD